MTFEDLNLISAIQKTLKSKGYSVPTPIQQKAIPHVLEGKDIFGMAQTGTGKTAAFALPLLQLLSDNKDKNQRGIKCLVLVPTRELAQQVSESFRDYGKALHLKHTVVYGGVSQRPQTDALRAGVDILIATPGRLLDLINQGFVQLKYVKHLVLDEADRMLDMGFIHDIRKVIERLPSQKQTLLFSATLPPEIKQLAGDLLNNPITVQTAPVSSPAENVKQYLYFIPKDHKRVLLKNILGNTPDYHILVFVRTKRNAERLAKNLTKEGIKAETIHGDKSQSARQKALQLFKSRKTNLLIATDVASRGLHVTDISHVINFDLPDEAEAYIHRIGRTGRSQSKGTAISFCSNEERHLLRDINKISRNKIEILDTPKLDLSQLTKQEDHTHAERPAGQPHPHQPKKSKSKSRSKEEPPTRRFKDGSRRNKKGNRKSGSRLKKY